MIYIENTTVRTEKSADYLGNAGYSLNPFYEGCVTAVPTSVPEINAGSLSQALLILFALWLLMRRRVGAGVA